jgi:LexA-binding, inner membrane-associated putative hydrolase
VSWAAHEFENYFIQKHVGVKASFVAICVGTFLPDLFTKPFVYQHSGNAAQFHRGWPGVGFSHSLIFGLFWAVLVLGLTRNRSWALGLLIGQWAHVLTDVSDTAGVMPFFPFSTDSVTIGMWKHAAGQGRLGDAAAYYSGLGGVWDLFWLVVLVVFARRALHADYFRAVVMPADESVWGWFRRRFFLTDNGLLVLYRAYFLYGLGRMVSWFLYARFQVNVPFQPIWGGPQFVPGNHLNDDAWPEVLLRTTIGGVLFAAFVWLCWVTFVRRLWQRGTDPAIVERGSGLKVAFH